MKKLTSRNKAGILLYKEERIYSSKFYDALLALEEYEKLDLEPDEIAEKLQELKCLEEMSPEEWGEYLSGMEG